jgi:DNA primase
MRFDAVQTIKDRLTMREVLLRYGYTPKRRMPCPLHNGKDNNFEVKEHSFMCYSQCGGGDVITFVQKLFNLSFPDTLKKIDIDFGLNIYGEHTFEDLRKSHYRQKQIQAERERKKREKEQAENEYWVVYDEYVRLEKNSREYRPKTPDEEWHPLFVEALQKMAYQSFLLDCVTWRKENG